MSQITKMAHKSINDYLEHVIYHLRDVHSHSNSGDDSADSRCREFDSEFGP